MLTSNLVVLVGGFNISLIISSLDNHEILSSVTYSYLLRKAMYCVFNPERGWGEGKGGGGAYMLIQRGFFLCIFGKQYDIDFDHFSLKP